jgi:hypothetical protein
MPSACFVYGFFNIGEGVQFAYQEALPEEDGANFIMPPVAIYIRYSSALSNAAHAVVPVSVRSPLPLPAAVVPANTFVYVAGRMSVRPGDRPTLIDAHDIVIIPADAGPPLSTDETLYPQSPATRVVACGRVSGNAFTLPDLTLVIPVRISQIVWGRQRAFVIGCVPTFPPNFYFVLTCL